MKPPGPHLRSLIAALALAALCGCAVDDSPTAPPGATGPPLLMVFTSDRPPSNAPINDLYFADLARGGNAFPVPNVNSASDEGPASLSGDGRTLAYTSSRVFLGSLIRIALQDVATGALRIPKRTSTLSTPLNPSLTHDARYLAVNYSVGNDPFLQAIACEDLAADTLLPLPNINEIGVTNFDPSLNADGTLIAFATNGSRSIGAFDVVLYSVPGDSFIALPGLNTNQNDLGPVLSGDGRYIVFQSGRPGGAGLIDVYLYDRQTSSLVPLPGLNSPLSEVQPFLSPDGRYIACMTESQGAEDILLYDVVNRRRVPLSGVNDPRYFEQYPSLAHHPGAIAR